MFDPRSAAPPKPQSEPRSGQTVCPGKYVSLTYSIADAHGNIVEQTDLPVGYVHGGRTLLIGGLEAAVSGRRAGDQVDLELSPEDGFGPHDPTLTFTDALENVPPQFRRLGAQVQMQNDAGELRTFYVTDLGADTLTVDGNHPLAGQSLRVHVWIRDVRDPTAAELAQDGSAVLPGGLLP
jgi:FKBP-type peptidyl-prolyl cis-trans isomerase SlyD